MRKSLSRAVALVSIVTLTASAAEFRMRVGGYYETHLGYAAPDYSNTGLKIQPDATGFDVKRGTELRFRPSVRLDNGIRIGAEVQLSGVYGGIDNSFMTVEGSFGRFLIGARGDARTGLHFGAPRAGSVGWVGNYLSVLGGVRGGDEAVSVGDGGTLTSTNGGLSNRRSNADAITYYSPIESGFRFGASYARDPFSHSNEQADLTDLKNAHIVDLGANYRWRSEHGFGVRFSTGYGTAFGDGEEKPQLFGGGLNLGWREWTVGGSIGHANNVTSSRVNGAGDGSAFDVGIRYVDGPWGASFRHFSGKNKDDEAFYWHWPDGFYSDIGYVRPHGVTSAEERLDTYELGLEYVLARGVTLHAFGAYAAFEEDVGDNGMAPGNDVSGFFAGAGLLIFF